MAMITYFLISLLGASLLFIVQPMAAKVALPILGGSPFVWNGCMVFFQALLLGGYLYAHVLNSVLPAKRQPWVHLPLLALALLAFPLSFGGSASVDAAGQPMLWLFSMLALSVGLPFFVLSATSPLSQRWFAASTGRQPYVLYAASNLGSFAGLLAYPALIEPLLPIRNQASILYYGFVALLVLFILGALQLRGAKAPVKEKAISATPFTPKVWSWIALAFVPSSLLYGVTTYITTDIASVPLFWVLPLALYLLTFVLIFGNKAPSLSLWRTLHVMGAPAMALLALLPLTYPVVTLLLHLVVFFAAAMMCHSRLSDIKPAPEQLTGFFLWVSFGGVLGGVFNSFIAPAIFTTVIEYPLMLLMSLIVVGSVSVMARPSRDDLGKVMVVWAVYGGLFWVLGSPSLAAMVASIGKSGSFAALLLSGILLVMAGYFLHKDSPLKHLLWLAPMLLVVPPLFSRIDGDQIAYTDRNVFGVSRVTWKPEKSAWVFRHGTTYHGVQPTDSALRLKPASYYGWLKDVYAALPPRLASAPVAVMGMGVGTVACYGTPGQQYDFFEIDPLVDKIAHDTRYFTYLKDCKPEKNIIMGDGRIGLGHSEDGRYGFIIIDVFSSDAIPMHILTREAVAMYATKLREGGLIAFNISNRHIDLLPVLAAIAEDAGLHGVSRIFFSPSASSLDMSAQWVVLAKQPTSLRAFTQDKGWTALPKPDTKFLWRDDYSNILRSVRF